MAVVCTLQLWHKEISIAQACCTSAWLLSPVAMPLVLCTKCRVRVWVGVYVLAVSGGKTRSGVCNAVQRCTSTAKTEAQQPSLFPDLQLWQKCCLHLCAVLKPREWRIWAKRTGFYCTGSLCWAEIFFSDVVFLALCGRFCTPLTFHLLQAI